MDEGGDPPRASGGTPHERGGLWRVGRGLRGRGVRRARRGETTPALRAAPPKRGIRYAAHGAGTTPASAEAPPSTEGGRGGTRPPQPPSNPE
ncbi:MAG: hypothetical protein LBM98_00510 [Oscillospiraceae bacterium]|nr:hypothetical protein [Oscillospiraceae bacterium]